MFSRVEPPLRIFFFFFLTTPSVPSAAPSVSSASSSSAVQREATTQQQEWCQPTGREQQQTEKRVAGEEVADAPSLLFARDRLLSTLYASVATESTREE